jgi:putative DNA primase/helicase
MSVSHTTKKSSTKTSNKSKTHLKDVSALKKSLFAKGATEFEIKRAKDRYYLYSQTDTGNSERLANKCKDEFVYCTQVKGRWLYFNGQRWVKDHIHKLNFKGKAIITEMENEALLLEEDLKAKLLRHIIYSLSDKGRKAMISQAANEFDHVDLADFDKQPYLFNVQNGTIDLETQKLLPHDSKHYLMNIANVAYDKKARSLLWEKSILQMMEGKPERVKYLQKMIGYALSAATVEQCIFIFYGPGGNGKTSVIEPVYYMLGDYAKAASPSTLMIKPESNNGHNADIAALKGRRFVTAIETNKRQKFDEAILKQLTGDDFITASFKYGDPFDFKPQHKILLACNHLPIIEGVGHGIWRRIKPIPFNVKFEGKSDDKKLRDKLKQPQELSGILNWAIEGFRLWQLEGLNDPPEVIEAKTEYREQMDPLSDFLNRHLEKGPGYKEYTNHFWNRYDRWYAKWGNGIAKLHKGNRGDAMRERGYTMGKDRNNNFYIGLRLIDIDKVMVDGERDEYEYIEAQDKFPREMPRGHPKTYFQALIS